MVCILSELRSTMKLRNFPKLGEQEAGDDALPWGRSRQRRPQAPADGEYEANLRSLVTFTGADGLHALGTMAPGSSVSPAARHFQHNMLFLNDPLRAELDLGGSCSMPFQAGEMPLQISELHNSLSLAALGRHGPGSLESVSSQMNGHHQVCHVTSK